MCHFVDDSAVGICHSKYRVSFFYFVLQVIMIKKLTFQSSTSDRIGFGTTNLLTLVVFQTIVTAEMPKSSDAVTALSKYIIALIIISAVGIFQSVVAERLLRTTTKPPPFWATTIMSIFPMCWGSQLPSGINQMILEGSDCSNQGTTDGKGKSKSSFCNCCCGSLEAKDNVWTQQDGDLALVKSPTNVSKRNGSAKSPRLNAVKVTKKDKKKMYGKYRYSYTTREFDSKFGSPSDMDDYIMETLRARSSNGFNCHGLSSVNSPTCQSLTNSRVYSISSSSSLSDKVNSDEKKSEDQLKRIQHGILWGELVTKFDHLVFVSCMFLAVFIPTFLFVPLVVFDELCSTPL